MAVASKYKPDMPEIRESAKILSNMGSSKGGIVRAKSLSPQQRQSIAKKAIDTRWNNNTIASK